MITLANGKMYFEVGDILYYPHFDSEKQLYEIEELKVLEVDEIRATLSPSKSFQKYIGLEYTRSYNLFLSREEACAWIEEKL